MSALQLNNVSVAPWGSTLLEGINFTLEPGEILGVIGPNGAGKTTLLNTIAGDTPPHCGDFLLHGKPYGEWQRRLLARKMAYLQQLSLLNFPFTVEEVILLGRSPHDTGSTRDREILEEVLRLVDITDLRDRLYTRLSGGEKQRVQLARVFSQIWQQDSMEGTLLLLDEPTAALDIQHQQSTAEAIKSLAERGCAVVLVLHDFNAITSLATRLVALKNGKQVALGAPLDIFTEKFFADVFAADVVIAEHPNRNQPMIISR
jgi:iron complex transport system ATP-binding protein